MAVESDGLQLVSRMCVRPKCRVKFKVLEKDEQVYCSAACKYESLPPELRRWSGNKPGPKRIKKGVRR